MLTNLAIYNFSLLIFKRTAKGQEKACDKMAAGGATLFDFLSGNPVQKPPPKTKMDKQIAGDGSTVEASSASKATPENEPSLPSRVVDTSRQFKNVLKKSKHV